MYYSLLKVQCYYFQYASLSLHLRSEKNLMNAVFKTSFDFPISVQGKLGLLNKVSTVCLDHPVIFRMSSCEKKSTLSVSMLSMFALYRSISAFIFSKSCNEIEKSFFILSNNTIIITPIKAIVNSLS